MKQRKLQEWKNELNCLNGINRKRQEKKGGGKKIEKLLRLTNLSNNEDYVFMRGNEFNFVGSK